MSEWVCVFDEMVVVGMGGCASVREILKRTGWGGWGGQPPRYALLAEVEFQTTQEDGGDDVKDNRHIHMLSFSDRAQTPTAENILSPVQW